MNMVSSIRHAIVQQDRQPLSLREGQIIQGKITKIYPDNKAAIQIGNHKLVAEITTPLSVGKQYFFQVQKADQVQLKVLGEQHTSNKTTNMDVDALLHQLGLKATKMNQTMIRQLIQDKIPFNEEQIHQAFLTLTKASDKSEAIEIIKSMISMKLPMTETSFKALQMNRQETISNLMHQVYNELEQQKAPTGAERTLLHHLETLLSRSATNQSPAFVQQIIQAIKPSSEVMNALKSLGLVDMSVDNNHWEETVKTASAANDASKVLLQAEQKGSHSVLKVPTNQQEAELIRSIMHSLLENGGDIQRIANRIKMIFSGLNTATLSMEQLTQAIEMVEKELFSLLPKETVQIIQQALQQATSSQTTMNQGQMSNQEQQRILFQILDVFGKGSTFRELATLAATTMETSEIQTTVTQQQISTQFMNHIRNYMQWMGLNDEYELKLNLENPNQIEAMKSEPSIKSMLMNMVQGQEGNLGNRAQALVHFINGMQMQTVTEVNNTLQASFMLPGEKISLNQDVFMQFEGKKNESGKIDADFCRILFVLDLKNMKETMIDMQVQKRIISVYVYNEQEEPSMLEPLRPMLKDALENIDYQLSTVQWKPLYDQAVSTEVPTNNTATSDERDRERYDFLI